ncbi:hypothetical protein SteCoe_18761 [Stentor coeruleus]|uniref:Vps41 beta-propeller domain-containing protein n=1 Tax=Stentor coeruleus TaxID=5963 RepID=A0A1R2BVP6_9CILI|nr:hypothetical protein SteCoe_18761 [Stentor coeruleus]
MAFLDNYFGISNLPRSISDSLIIDLETKKQINALIEKHLNQITIHKRYIYDLGRKKMQEIETKTHNTLQRITEKNSSTKSKHKLIELQNISKKLIESLRKIIDSIEKCILEIFTDLNQISQESVTLYNKSNYTNYEMRNLKNLISRDICANQANIFKNLSPLISKYEKITIKILSYLSPKISSNFLKDELGLISEGHCDAISCIQISKNNNFFISGSHDGTLRLWNLQTKSQEHVFYGHKGPVNTLVLTKDGKLAISGSDEGSIIIWDIEKRRLVKSINAMVKPIHKIELTFDDKYFISLSKSSDLICWDMSSLGDTDTLVISKDAKYFKLFHDRYYIIYCEKNELICKDILNLNEEPIFAIIHFYKPYNLKISNYGNFSLIAHSKKIIRFYNDNGNWKQDFCCIHNHNIRCLEIASNDEFILTLSRKSIRVWSLSTYICLKKIQSDDFLYSKIFLSKDDNLFLCYSNSNSIKIFNTKLGSREVSIKSNEKITSKCCITENSKYLIFGCNDGSIALCNIIEKSIKQMKNHTKKVRCACLSYDISLVATGSNDKKVIVWNIKTREIVAFHTEHSSPITCIDIRKDNKVVVSGSFDQNIIIWDIIKQTLRARLEGHSGPVKSLSFFKNKTNLASGVSNNQVIIWNLIKKSKSQIINGHTSEVIKIEVIENFIFSASKNEIIVWSLIKKKIKHFIPLYSSCKIIAASKTHSFFAIETQSKNILIWDSIKNKKISKVKVKSTKNCVVLTEDMKFICATNINYVILIYDAKIQKKISMLEGHLSQINDMVLTEDEQKLLTVSSDSVIIIWDLKYNFRCILLTGHMLEINTICLTKDKNYFVTGSSDGIVQIWSFDEKKIVGENNFSSGVLSLAITSDNRFIFLGLHNTNLELYDNDSKLSMILTNFETPVMKVGITSNDKYCISISTGLNLKVWNIQKHKIEIVYSAKDYLLNSFIISQDCAHIYVPSDFSGLAILNLKNTINKGKKQQKDYCEVEVTEDVLDGFVKIYDIELVKIIAERNEEVEKFFRNFLFLD